MSATLHDSADFPWPTTADAQLVRQFFAPLLGQNPACYFQNVQADCLVAQAEEIFLPVTVSTYAPGQSYVVSPRSHYVDYAREEAARLPQRALRVMALAAVAVLKKCMGTGLDAAVMVNNWMLSTNLYPAQVATAAVPILETLIATYPHLPVIFRSVDLRTNRPLFETLCARGARPILARSIFYQDVHADRFWHRRQLREDAKRWANAGYQCRALQLPEDDALLPRVLALYRMLYVEKYSALNPQLTLEFLRTGFLKIRVIERDGRVDGVWGYWVRNGVMTQPLFGYDTSLPQRLGLYTHLSLDVLQEAKQLGCLVNASAGAGPFKCGRGAEQTLEYNLVYDQHLPASQRRAWTILEKLLGPYTQRIILDHGI